MSKKQVKRIKIHSKRPEPDVKYKTLFNGREHIKVRVDKFKRICYKFGM